MLERTFAQGEEHQRSGAAEWCGDPAEGRDGPAAVRVDQGSRGPRRVSFQTAAKVLNGGDVRVSTETQERILAAAAELGYRPNTIARSLVQRATATIGLVASDATDVAIAQASVAAEQAARRNGHSVLVGHLAADGWPPPTCSVSGRRSSCCSRSISGEPVPERPPCFLSS